METLMSAMQGMTEKQLIGLYSETDVRLTGIERAMLVAAARTVILAAPEHPDIETLKLAVSKLLRGHHQPRERG